MSIGKNLKKIFLKLGNQRKVMNQINTVNSQVVTFSKDSFTKKTVFDPIINKPAIF